MHEKHLKHAFAATCKTLENIMGNPIACEAKSSFASASPLAAALTQGLCEFEALHNQENLVALFGTHGNNAQLGAFVHNVANAYMNTIATT